MKIYNKEKVLYFADSDQALHVSIDEPKGSDLKRLVADAIAEGLIVREAKDNSGSYFKTTNKGKAELLRLQIRWRQQRRRDTTALEEELKKIQYQESAA